MAIIDILPLPQHLPPPEGYSHVLRWSSVVVTSSYTGILPDGSLVQGGLAAETEQALKNLSAVLETAGCRWSDIIRINVALTDLHQFETFERVFIDYFEAQHSKKGKRPYPTRTVNGVQALLGGAHVSLDAWAIKVW